MSDPFTFPFMFGAVVGALMVIGGVVLYNHDVIAEWIGVWIDERKSRRGVRRG